MKRILFVDDDQNVLDGLQNLLRRQRQQWDMVFTLGAHAALEELQKGASFDVVVSDMRMPGMDGAELLQRVKDEFPSTTRIVLSGHAEREAIARALPVAHQFLSKPCDAAVLRDVIGRTCDVNALINDATIRQVVGKIDKLPSAPRTYWELTQAIANPDVSVYDLATIVERDPAMSVKVLQLVNSAYFGLAQRVTSIQQAVKYLGVELLKGLALTAHVFAIRLPKIDGFSVTRIQESSLLTARLCRSFLSAPKLAEEAFTAALVHDIGRIVIAAALPKQLAAVLRTARETGEELHVIERDLLGVSHAEIGAYLLGVWGLPFAIVEAVAHHHSPRRVTGGARDVLAALHVADALADTVCGGAAESPGESKLDLDFLEEAGLTHHLPRWTALALSTRNGGERS